jgi:3-oxoacyl-[acyl-carrier protein] reductase/sorbitol-6-phosphate 2-dehydrogenase
VSRVIPNRFEDKVALITGAANGIGREIAIRLAKEGAHCVLSDINGEALAAAEAAITAQGGSAKRFEIDITDNNQITLMVLETLQSKGKIDIVIPCAGIVQEGPIEDISERTWDRVFDVNLKSIYFLLHQVIPLMKARRYGKIVNISSQSGIFGRPRRVAYSASKFALNGLTQALALEVAEYGITVNAVCPSRIKSAMTDEIIRGRVEKSGNSFDDAMAKYQKTVPIGRLGRASDVASLATYLASDEAEFITGQFMSTSGGR